MIKIECDICHTKIAYGEIYWKVLATRTRGTLSQGIDLHIHQECFAEKFPHVFINNKEQSK